MLPDRVIIFRDGVGDGQLKICREHEVNQFLEACREISPNYSPKLSMVVIQKRINTRFFNIVVRILSSFQKEIFKCFLPFNFLFLIEV